MSLALADVVPWGRSFTEYRAMFALSETDLAGRILGCGDGPAGFNAQLTRQGGRVVSVDPLYSFSGREIQDRIRETFTVVLDQVRKNEQDFVWSAIPDLDSLGRTRREAMDLFLADYRQGKEEGRYRAGQLPELDFPDQSFALALCSHFLFLYSAQRSKELHIKAVLELCRVAGEVRIFPLLELSGRLSRHCEDVFQALDRAGYTWRVERVAYEFQRGGNEMLRIFSSDRIGFS
jgi:hypothetical protein